MTPIRKFPSNPLCVCGHTLSQHERIPNVIRESSPIYCGFCKCKDFHDYLLDKPFAQGVLWKTSKPDSPAGESK